MENGLEVLLLKLNGIVETRRRQLEALSREYGILLKPWPHKDKSTSDKTLVKDDGDTDTMQAKPGEETRLTAEEQTKVDQVDKLLLRAQKALDLKAKLENKQNSNQETRSDGSHLLKKLQFDKSDQNIIPEVTIRSEIRNLILQEKNKSPESSSCESVKNTGKNKLTSHSKESSQGDTHSKTVTSTNSHMKNDVSHVTNDSHTRNSSQSASHTRGVSNASNSTQSRSASHSRVAPHSVKSSHTTSFSRTASHGKADTKTAGFARNAPASASSSKDKSVTFPAPRISRPSSSRGKSYSAHVNAPFKTDPTIRVPRTSINKAAMKSQPTARLSSGQGRGMKAKVYGNKKGTDHITNHQTRNDNPDKEGESDSQTDKTKVMNIDHIPDLVKQAMSVSVSNCVDSSKESLSVLSNMDGVSDKLVSGLKDQHVFDSQTDGQTTDQSENLFTLQQDGAKLPIPSKLRRLTAANQKLREKIAAKKVTKKVECRDARTDFIQRLEEQFCPDEDLVNQTLVMSCLHAHSRLHKLLEDLQLDNITELSSKREVLAAKMKMEYILTSCDSLQEEMDTLINADFSGDKNKPSPPLCQPREASVYQWMPEDYMSDDCLSSGTILSYKKPSELQEYRHHIFQLQYLRLQSVIMAMSKKELLPLLQSTDPKSRSYTQVYRAVFAFLTSFDGHRLPAIVQDS